MKNSTSFLCAVVLGLVLAAAGSSCGTAEELFDCQSVCSRYKTCFNQQYDVDACRNRCKENSEKDREFKRKADTCETCIDDRSCSEATFKCAASCGSVVP